MKTNRKFNLSLAKEYYILGIFDLFEEHSVNDLSDCLEEFLSKGNLTEIQLLHLELLLSRVILKIKEVSDAKV